MKKSTEQKVLELGEAKENVDRLGREFWSAADECPNIIEYEYGLSHIVEAIEGLKNKTIDLKKYMTEDPLQEIIADCPACKRAFEKMQEKKAAKRVLSGKKGVVLKEAKRLYLESLKAVPNG